MIPTRNRPSALRKTVDALAGQRLEPGAMEVIVVDNGSQPEAAAETNRLRLNGPFALTVLSEPRSGASAARNAGISVARGEHVLFLGDDTRPSGPDLVSAHLRALAGGDDGRLAVLGACVWAPEIELTPVMEWLERTGKSHDYAAFTPGEAAMTNLYTNNLSIPRRALLEVGGFDERFPQYGWEDYDLALRLADRGFRLRFLPELIVLHHHRYGLRESLRRMESVGRTASLLNRLHASREQLITPRPGGPLAALARALAPVAERLPIPGWLPGPLRNWLFRAVHFGALARGYARAPLPDDPGRRGGVREVTVR